MAIKTKAGDFERLMWDTDSNLGKIVTLDGLKALFPLVKIIEENSKFVTYGSQGRQLAYGCKQCGLILVGPPEIVDRKETAGRVGYDSYCKACYAGLRNVEWVIS